MRRSASCKHGGPTKENGNCEKPGLDGLPVQCVGEWAENEKHTYLRLYIDATRQARRKFLVQGHHGPPGGAGYIDIYAGPGRVRVRDTGEVFDGSPLIALQHKQSPFTTVVLCDLDDENVSALRARTAEFGGRAKVFQGDCNAIVGRLVDALPELGLNLAFVDPFKLDPLHFNTLKALAQRKRIDLVVNFPTQDAKRNLERYLEPGNDLLDRALGTTAWRQRVKAPRDVHRVTDVLIEQLEALGYTGTRNRTISVKNSKNAELYRLIFASKDPLGDKIWTSITTHTALGQRGFDFA